MRVDRRGGADSGLPPIATRTIRGLRAIPRTGTVAPTGIGPVPGPGADLMPGHRRPGIVLRVPDGDPPVPVGADRAHPHVTRPGQQTAAPATARCRRARAATANPHD
jgi:hypothetical protein